MANAPPISVSLQLSEGSPDDFERTATRFGLEVVNFLLPSGHCEFVRGSDCAMDGAGQFVVRADITAVRLDRELRAALRTYGIDLEASDNFHGDSPVGALSSPTMENAGDAGNGSPAAFEGRPASEQPGVTA